MQKNATTIKAPGWVAEDDVLSLLRQDLQLKLAYYDSQCRNFEQKHQKSFAEFEAEIHTAKNEDFEKWEEFMDWEAADCAREEIKLRLKELSAWKT
jgi:hypothetical protein